MTNNADPAWISALITGMCTLSAGLGGAALTLKVSGSRQKTDRAIEYGRERNREQREAIIEVIDAGREWASTQEIVFLVFHKMSEAEVAESRSIDEQVLKLRRYRKSLIRARLVITDEELAPLIRAFSSSLGGLPEVGEKLARLRKKRDEHAETEAVGEALAFIASHNRMLDEIEMSALNRLTVEVGDD